MPELPHYESHLSHETVAFVVALPKRKQRKLLDLADQIARQPNSIGDYRTSDSAGRTIEHLLLEGFLFSYWTDHASRELRITEIVQV
ncbi:MAG TPA: hypothetical protein VGL42_11560 [Opitutaceae bacterium]|jgi:hypothetical protein